MKKDTYKYLNCANITPQGWLKNKLEILNNGLTGHLDEIWPDVGENNGWLGGSGDNWERGPYYLDGLIPAALESKNQDLEKKALNWIHHIISSQDENGFFGPVTNKDWWPRMVAMKALIIYADSKNHTVEAKQIQLLIQKFLHYFNQELNNQPLEMWGYARGMETYVAIKWMFDQTGDVFYENLANRVNKLSFPWNSKFFKKFPYIEPISKTMAWKDFLNFMEKYENKNIKENYNFYFDNYHLSHGVNIAMAVKYLAYEYQLSKDNKYLINLEKGINDLLKYHGQANGMYSCDEHLNGISPIQGTELCTVVELMFSIEEIIKITGDLKWFDWLEKIAFNALEATISQDGFSHQYDQQVNQISCTIDKRPWYNNKDDSNIYGLEPHFGCCTANMHQGWPKFISSLWGKAKNEYICFSLAPISFIDNGISIDVESNYPYASNAKISISNTSDKKFSIKLNIASYCNDFEIYIDKKPINFKIIDRCIVLEHSWSKNEIDIKFKFKFEKKIVNNGISFYYGPFLFAYPIDAKDTIIKDRNKFSDHEFRPKQKWNYGIKNNAEGIIEYVNGFPNLLISSYEITNWTSENNCAGKFPTDPILGESKLLRLIPYGKTILRISNFPIIE